MWRQRRDSTNILYLLRVAEELGLSAQACLRDSGLNRSALEDAEHNHELWQELAVIRNLVAMHSDPGLGLRIGRLYHLTSLGLLGYTMLASRTLSEAIKVSGRFRPLSLSICPVSLQQHENGLAMVLDDSVLPVDARRLVVERGLAAWTALYGELLQHPFIPLHIELRFGQEDQAMYAQHFGCGVTVGAQRNAMILDWDALRAELPLANPLTQRTCASLCQQLCDSLDDVRGPFSRQVLQKLMSHSGRINRASEVAGWLGVSERTLHRRLLLEGNSFRLLDERVRRRLAEHLLAETGLRLESVAQQLGYGEAASFSRAFKRWTGRSPLTWRKEGASSRYDPLIEVLTMSHAKTPHHA